MAAAVSGAADGVLCEAEDAVRRLTWPLRIEYWNDTPGRTREEVLDLLQRAELPD